jgi:hypothetical protein
MIVRPIKITARLHSAEVSVHYKETSSIEPRHGRSKFDKAAEVIAKSQQIRRLHMKGALKRRRSTAAEHTDQRRAREALQLICERQGEELMPSYTTSEAVQLVSVFDAQVATSSDLDEADQEAFLVSVNHGRFESVKVKHLSLTFDSPVRPRHRPAISPQSLSPYKSSATMTRITRLRLALTQSLRSPSAKRPQSSKRHLRDSSLKSKLSPHSSLQTAMSPAYVLARRLSEGSAEILSASGVFDKSQVIRNIAA